MTPAQVKRLLHASCLRKQNLSEEEANCIVDQALREEGLLLYYYKCDVCWSYHLTKQVPSDAQKVLEVS
jgi:hypothetical protein